MDMDVSVSVQSGIGSQTAHPETPDEEKSDPRIVEAALVRIEGDARTLIQFGDEVLETGTGLALSAFRWARHALFRYAVRPWLVLRTEFTIAIRHLRLTEWFAARRAARIGGLFAPGYVPPSGAWWRPPRAKPIADSGAATNTDDEYMEVELHELLPRSSPPPLPQAARAQALESAAMRARLSVPDLSAVPRGPTD